MTPYHVEWTDADLDMLADIWMQATNRAAVNAAQNTIDVLLARDPFGNGQLLSEELYRINEPPLIVNYTIDFVQRHAEVTWVRFLRTVAVLDK